MTQEQVESQLSAMFDGELPAAECELLSRRIDRDENLRARWSRYALIGAAMRSEPVATAPRGFAARVSAALDANERAPVKQGVSRRRTLWNTALAASMVTAVAGVSIGMLRYSAPGGANIAVSRVVAPSTQPNVATRVATPVVAAVDTVPTSQGLVPVELRTGTRSNGEPRSYVTPVNQASSNTGLRTELPDLVVAHSVYSTPLMRRNLLSALVSSEEGGDSSDASSDGNGTSVKKARADHGNAAPASGTTGR